MQKLKQLAAAMKEEDFKLQMPGCIDINPEIMLTTKLFMREKLTIGLASADALLEEVLPKCLNLSVPAIIFRYNIMGFLSCCPEYKLWL